MSGLPSCGSDCGGDGPVTEREREKDTILKWQYSAPEGVTVWTMYLHLRLYMCQPHTLCPPLPLRVGWGVGGWRYQPWPRPSLSWTNWVGRSHDTFSYNIYCKDQVQAAFNAVRVRLPSCQHVCLTSINCRCPAFQHTRYLMLFPQAIIFQWGRS